MEHDPSNVTTFQFHNRTINVFPAYTTSKITMFFTFFTFVLQNFHVRYSYVSIPTNTILLFHIHLYISSSQTRSKTITSHNTLYVVIQIHETKINQRTPIDVSNPNSNSSYSISTLTFIHYLTTIHKLQWYKFYANENKIIYASTLPIQIRIRFPFLHQLIEEYYSLSAKPVIVHRLPWWKLLWWHWVVHVPMNEC